MKKSFNIYLALAAFATIAFTQSCVEAEDLVTPNVASPVLVLLEGNSFSAAASVTVGSQFLELDKTYILDHTKGIDSIPVPNLNIAVFINNTNEVAKLVTDSEGSADLVISWADLGLPEAKKGDQVRLEFAGTHKNVAFRKYHTVRVN
ncbi:hypothetical protein SYJ56_13600 [Algoriphagus sp. D3-2-R+10]|uniref:hypothetical protein n=1 Tax=Algoriphagus aurantiacus TaxID=3103948 RepID=UPI002B3DAE2C|nr:hypothetical protein [Algoriphagus sp. D3-2-R+10]MEB2776352.1 hypothetical protein [Algoriphagus sp. D3-2-R+10]